ncbi:hypothetical protein G5B10_00075 [Fluviicola sp. SGL-29]|nr:hypothetical protein [Fluviicola sp. SGL-29]
MKHLFWILLVGLTFFSCGRYNDDELKTFDDKIAAYVKKNNLDMTRSESGLYYNIQNEGEGDLIKPTDVISAIYKGKLLNGKVFDEKKEPTELTLKNLVHGWREIAYYLKPGGKATIICPPQLGYGQQAIGEIPEDAILIFDIEIIDAY